MADPFFTFQTFNDIELAKEIGEKLRLANIECLIEDNQRLFDPSFANNSIQTDISIRLQAKDFAAAHKALEEYYKKELDTIDKGYYLFDFTDDELMEIISKPDEWGHFDYQLAKKILSHRGKEVSPELAIQLKHQRIEELSTPAPSDKYWIFFGYFCAILGPFGLLIGWILAYFKKTLPDGQRVYAYREEERTHGKIILLISVASLIFWVFVR